MSSGLIILLIIIVALAVFFWLHQRSLQPAVVTPQASSLQTATSSLTPQVAAFVNTLKGSKPLYDLTPTAAREVLDNIQRSNPVASPNATITDTEMNGVSVRIVTKPGETIQPNTPVILYIHGGGWILGNAMTHDHIIRTLATRTDCAVVFVNYSRSPEAQYPTAINEIQSVLSYISDYLQPSHLVVVGDSVGGNMAIATCLLAANKGISIDLQVLFYPVTDDNFNTESYLHYHDGPWLTKKAMEWFWNAYAPNHASMTDPLLTPLRATDDVLRTLPPTLIIVDENDVLRTEGLAFANRLRQLGVQTVAIQYNGTIHDFVMLNPLASTQQTIEAINMAVSMINEKTH